MNKPSETSSAKEDGLKQPSPAGRRWALLRPWLMPLIAVLLTVLLFKALHTLLDTVRYHDVIAALHALPASRVALALVATAISYVALTGYDFSSLRYVGVSLKRSTVMVTSFAAYALGNTVGLGVLSGGTVRMRMYAAAGVETQRIAQAIAFNTVAFLLGMVVFGAMGLLWGAQAVSPLLRLSPVVLQGLAALILAMAGAFIALCALRREVALAGRWTIPLPGVGLALRQLVLSAFELCASAAALWFLLPAGAMDWPTFAAFYAMAVALSLISHVPGGLGVFEAVILLGCGPDAPVAAVASALILYRGIYFILPLVLASVLLVSYELRGSAAARVGRAAVRLAPGLLAALTAVAGAWLMLQGATPISHAWRQQLGAMGVPLLVVEAAHLLGSVAGLVMLFVARGLLHRLDAAWWVAMGMSVLAALLAIPRGLAYSQMVLLAVLVVLLAVSRKQFDRRSRLFAQTFEPGWLAAVACIVAACLWILFFVYRDVQYADRLWWQFALDKSASRSMRALMVMSLLALGFGLWQLLRQPSGRVAPPSAQDLAKAADIVRGQPAADACLVLMGDKHLLFSVSGNSFIMFGKQGRSWIALGDPVGLPQEWPELVWRFIETAHAHGGRAAFYKTRPQTLSMYLDAGLRAYKLGEEAYVSLPAFSLAGSRRANLRHGASRGEREGLQFDIVPADEVAGILPELRAVSDAWLDQQHAQEKRFSLGAFEDAYLCRQPVAVVRAAGVITAFATLMAPEALRAEASIDLMRQRPGSPAGTMDFLFARILLHYKAQGYQRFGLGMAPMSGMQTHALAPRWHRFGQLMFQYGERFYNFRGLRSFKDKFAPTWEARYLVTPGGVAPLIVLADTAALIGRGLKGVITK